MAYASDTTLLDTVALPHAIAWTDHGWQIASLDHAMWFHRPFRADEWLLYALESPISTGARGFATGRLFARDGSLVSLDAHFVLRDAGIDIPRETGATDLKVQRHLVSAADVILVMTEEQRRMLAANFPEAAGKTVLTLRELAGEAGDIEDPATRDEHFFRHTRDEIARCLEQGLDRLVADVDPAR